MKSIVAAIACSLVTLGMGQSSQAQLTAHEALLKVKERYGDEPINGIVELIGQQGVSQPKSWKLVFFDPGNDYKLRIFRIREDGIRDEGPSEQYYPGRVPAGFIAMKDVRIGSKDAIKRADTAAKLAKIGFTSVDYVLRAKELTHEPIWILKLRNADGVVVGTVFISGDNGAVLRNQFIYLDQPTRSGEPTFMDSAIRKLRERNEKRKEEEEAGLNPPVAPPIVPRPGPNGNLNPGVEPQPKLPPEDSSIRPPRVPAPIPVAPPVDPRKLNGSATGGMPAAPIRPGSNGSALGKVC